MKTFLFTEIIDTFDVFLPSFVFYLEIISIL